MHVLLFETRGVRVIHAYHTGERFVVNKVRVQNDEGAGQRFQRRRNTSGPGVEAKARNKIVEEAADGKSSAIDWCTAADGVGVNALEGVGDSSQSMY